LQDLCLLDGFSNYRLGGILPGFPLDREVIEAGVFVCRKCQGSGWYLDESREAGVHCQLKARHNRILDLAAPYYQRWKIPLDLEKMRTQAMPIFFGRWMEAFLQGKEKRGRAFHSPEAGRSPSVFWQLALAAVWRFGINAHVISASKPEVHKLTLSHRLNSDYPSLVFVEGLDKLWLSEVGFEFESIISTCEKSGFPLWVEVVGHDKSLGGEHEKKGRKNPFQNKIASLKQGPMLDWLPEDSRSRMLSLCQGTDVFLSPG
jgi:hypothetical protein